MENYCKEYPSFRANIFITKYPNDSDVILYLSYVKKLKDTYNKWVEVNDIFIKMYLKDLEIAIEFKEDQVDVYFNKVYELYKIVSKLDASIRNSYLL